MKYFNNEELPTVFKVVNDIFNNMPRVPWRIGTFQYAIPFNIEEFNNDKETAMMRMDWLKNHYLTRGNKLYTVDNINVFEVKNSLKETVYYIAYIIKENI